MCRAFTPYPLLSICGNSIQPWVFLQLGTENFREFSEAKVHWSLSLPAQGLMKAKLEQLKLLSAVSL